MAKIVIASEIVYISPVSCDSTVGYKIIPQQHYNHKKEVNIPSFYAEVSLTDCSRKVSWEFGNNKESLQKINKAISVLNNFKKEFVKARKMFPRDTDEDSDN